MRNHPLATLATVCLAPLAIASLSGCRDAKPTSPTAGTAETNLTRVTIARPMRKTIRRSVTQPGQVEAFEQARLYAKIPAYVERYFVDLGDAVKGPRFDEQGTIVERGQRLAQLSAPELDEEVKQKKALVAQAGADVEQAQAAIKVAQAELVSAEAQVEEALAAVARVDADFERWTSEYGRIVELVSKSVMTQRVADETKLQMQSAKAGRQEAQARIASARSNVAANEAQVTKKMADEVATRARREVAEADAARSLALVNYLTIEAPFDGTVTARNADTGYFAQGGGDGPALFELVRIDRVRVFVNLPEMDAPLATPGDPVTVRVQSLPGQEFAGTVTRTAWALDPMTRTLRTEADVPNTSGQLRPGMYARVSIDLAQKDNAIVLPATAIVSQDNGAFCVVIEGGKASRRPIVVGIKSGAEVEIVSGLSGDEQVVQAQAASLSEGQAVEAVAATVAK